MDVVDASFAEPAEAAEDRRRLFSVAIDNHGSGSPLRNAELAAS